MSFKKLLAYSLGVIAIVSVVSYCSRTDVEAKTIERTVNNVVMYDYTDDLAECISSFAFIPMIDTKGVKGICKGNPFKNYAILYDVTHKTPIMSMQRLFGTFGKVKRKNDFHEEPTLLDGDRPSLSDYKAVSYMYDKGHLTPAGDIPLSENINESNQAMRDTFTLANMTPQVSEFNRGVWGKVVEESTRKYVERVPNHKVFVYTGISGTQGYLANGTSIPAYMWKVIFDQTDNRAWAYWMPNSKDVSIETYPIIKVSELELLIKNNGLVVDFRLPRNVGFIKNPK